MLTILTALSISICSRNIPWTISKSSFRSTISATSFFVLFFYRTCKKRKILEWSLLAPLLVSHSNLITSILFSIVIFLTFGDFKDILVTEDSFLEAWDLKCSACCIFVPSFCFVSCIHASMLLSINLIRHIQIWTHHALSDTFTQHYFHLFDSTVFAPFHCIFLYLPQVIPQYVLFIYSSYSLFSLFLFHTGNSNTVGGGLVLPLADLGDLSGLENGSKNPTAMVDGVFCIPYFVFCILSWFFNIRRGWLILYSAVPWCFERTA